MAKVLSVQEDHRVPSQDPARRRVQSDRAGVRDQQIALDPVSGMSADLVLHRVHYVPCCRTRIDGRVEE